MFDNNLIFSNAQVVTADGFSTNALDVGKTPVEGVDVEVVATVVSGTTPTLDITAYTKDTDASWATTDRKAGVAQAQITAVGRYAFRIQTKNRYLKLYYDVGGTSPSFTLTAGIVSGKQQDAGV